MNRPRNRQPRQNPHPHQQHHSQGQNHNKRFNPKPASRVPDISQVHPGASISIVLKADQPTGVENQGIVQDVLTKGNHPRGIKVRLKDGRVGRVQRMVAASQARGGSGERWPASVPTSPVTGGEAPRERQRGWDGGGDANMPPARSLAEFFPDSPRASATKVSSEPVTFTSAAATCPICGRFEGDEAAVSHHVQSHLD